MFYNVKSLKIYFSVCAIFAFIINSNAQTQLDKVSHVEPLFYDLVRDLGARKGEKEINVGADFIKYRNYNEYAFLIEYEFAPINRLGFEVEADFSFFKRTNSGSEIPNNTLECLRFSSQYSFFVSTKLNTTLAAGYTQIVEFADFKNYHKSPLITGTVYNPFFIAAKRWGNRFHSLVYFSPLLKHHFSNNSLALNWQINTSFHYVIPHTKHFIGIEFNKEFIHSKFEMTIRPQVKFKLSPKLALGLVTGIPINKPDKICSSFLRIIYEP